MSLLGELKILQWKQLKHDEFYHKEICLLNVQRRITHMTLHLSKYSSKLVSAAVESNIALLHKSVIDTIIISLSSANIFSYLIGSERKDYSNLESLEQLTIELRKHYPDSSLGIFLDTSIKINSLTGKMCKAVESLDHLEAYPFRESILGVIVEIFEYSLVLANALGICNIAQQIAERLYTVEKKNLYFYELGNYKEGYK